MARNQQDFTFDASTQLKDAGLVAANAAAQVASVNKILDLGAARMDARCIVDTTAVDLGAADALYTVLVQGSNSATFANTIVTLGASLFGHLSTTLESASSPAAQRREISFCTEVSGTTYRYVRAFTKVAGTIATGINYTAFVVEDARN